MEETTRMNPDEVMKAIDVSQTKRGGEPVEQKMDGNVYACWCGHWCRGGWIDKK